MEGASVAYLKVLSLRWCRDTEEFVVCRGATESLSIYEYLRASNL
jgi:hypothetical protein